MKYALLGLCILVGVQACKSQNSVDEFALGEQALNAGNNATAVRHFTVLLEQQPRHERALVLRSKAKYQQRDYEGARKDSQFVLDINPAKFTSDDYNALWNLGVINNSIGQFTQARVYFDNMKKADSTDVRSYENIAYSYLQENNYAAALNELKAGIKVDSSSKQAFMQWEECFWL
jgi:tetratricopeptide (TPR) repeat protein